MELFLTMAAFGLLGGLIAGFLGVGGGLVYVYILELALPGFGVPPNHLAAFATINSIATVFFTSLAANYELYRKKEFYIKPVVVMASASIPISIILQHTVVTKAFYTLAVFHTLFLLILSFLLVRQFLNLRQKPNLRSPEDNASKQYLLTGISGGVIAALTGLGGGVAMVPLLNSWLKLDIKKSKSISLGVIMLTSLTLLISALLKSPPSYYHHWQYGYLVLPAIGSLAIGVFAGARLGVILSRRTPSRLISILFIALIVFLIARTLLQLLKIS